MFVDFKIIHLAAHFKIIMDQARGLGTITPVGLENDKLN